METTSPRPWRREEGARTWSLRSADKQARAAKTASFERDPRKTGHYDREFDSYISGGARDSVPEGIGQRTKRYDDHELAAHAVGVKDGFLTRADGTKMDTSASAATNLTGADAGRNIFALDGHDVHSANGVERRQALYAADAAKEHGASVEGALAANAAGAGGMIDHIHHSSFNGGQAVEGAGDIAVREGFVQRISNTSGHYEPGVQSNYQAVQALGQMGANLDSTTVENKTPNGFSGELDTETFQARGMLETGNNLELLRTHKRAFEMIRGRGQSADQPAVAGPASPYDAD